jgi:hypothetical protein
MADVADPRCGDDPAIPNNRKNNGPVTLRGTCRGRRPLRMFWGTQNLGQRNITSARERACEPFHKWRF